mmetsp:Transcript_14307/g.14127  ORF Transcript_14307/g.14127 Transcript_14307/m.14127 type:complete len:259 (+) Transcript_14307:303-1079(+)
MPLANIPVDQAQIVFEFQHDFLAEQTSFSIRNLFSHKIEYVGPQYVPNRGGVFNSTFLLPVPGKYAIEVYDTGMGDGLTNPDYVNTNYPLGSWVLSATYRNGGRLVALATGGADFDTVQTTQIRLPNMSSVPPLITDQPTMSPTGSPTESLHPSTVVSSSLAPSTGTSYEPTTTMKVEWNNNNNTNLAIGRDFTASSGTSTTPTTGRDNEIEAPVLSSSSSSSSSSVPSTHGSKKLLRSHYYTRSMMMLFLSSLGLAV